MKRKLIKIIIIVICLLLFMSNSSFAQHGKVWLEIFKERDRETFIMGYMSGIDYMFGEVLKITEAKIEENKTVPYDEGELVEKILEFRMYYDEYDKLQQLTRVITELYKEPANLYIGQYKMVWFAYQKIKGEDIGLLLQEARKEAWQYK